MATARKHGRYGFRDSLMVLLAYVHGFRASELVRLQWTDIDWERGLIHCRRVKNGTNTDHPLTGRELRGLRKLKAEQKPVSRYIFMTERGPSLHAGRVLQAHDPVGGEGEGRIGPTASFTALLRFQAGERWSRH